MFLAGGLGGFKKEKSLVKGQFHSLDYVEALGVSCQRAFSLAPVERELAGPPAQWDRAKLGTKVFSRRGERLRLRGAGPRGWTEWGWGPEKLLEGLWFPWKTPSLTLSPAAAPWHRCWEVQGATHTQT